MAYGLFDACVRRGERLILQSYTLALPQKGALCLLGPSGIGKTTALLALAGLLRLESGRVNAPPHGMLGVQFQEDRLLPWRSARDNILLVPGAQGTDAMLEALGIAEYADTPAGRMSGGQKRRVALARALTAPSQLLLLDEPFKGLDAAAKETAIRLVRDCVAKKPGLVITHDPAEAQAMDAVCVSLGG